MVSGTGSFNPRPCVRGDLFVGCGLGLLVRFNPRPCVRGDGLAVTSRLGVYLFQSTPLREGRLGHRQNRFLSHLVSIHAPA